MFVTKVLYLSIIKKPAIMEFTKPVLDAIQIWINVESVYSSDVETTSAVFQNAYNQECSLYSEFFPKFTPKEHETYRTIVQWLFGTGLHKSDLTLKQLINLYSK